MWNEGVKGCAVVVGVVLAMAMCTGQVQAQTASSNGYAISANVSVIGLDTLNVTPQAQVQYVNQTSGFEDSANVTGLNQTSTGGLISLGTGELSAETQYNAPAVPHGFAVVGTQASAADVDLGVVSGVPAGNSLLGITATALSSRAIVTGYCPPPPLQGRGNALAGIADDFVFRNGFDLQTLQALGGSDGYDDHGSPGISVSVSGTPLVNLPLDPAPNTGITLLGGLGSLILNEQTFTGDGSTSRGMEVNALHLTLTTTLLDAEVIIAHSEAGWSCP